MVVSGRGVNNLKFFYREHDSEILRGWRGGRVILWLFGPQISDPPQRAALLDSTCVVYVLQLPLCCSCNIVHGSRDSSWVALAWCCARGYIEFGNGSPAGPGGLSATFLQMANGLDAKPIN